MKITLCIIIHTWDWGTVSGIKAHPQSLTILTKFNEKILWIHCTWILLWTETNDSPAMLLIFSYQLLKIILTYKSNAFILLFKYICLTFYRSTSVDWEWIILIILNVDKISISNKMFSKYFNNWIYLHREVIKKQAREVLWVWSSPHVGSSEQPLICMWSSIARNWKCSWHF